MSDKSAAVQMAPVPTAPVQTTPVQTTSTQAPTTRTGLKLVQPENLADRINRLHDSIARRAFEIFENDGGFFGRDLEHWFRAEAELLHPVHLKLSESGNAIVVEAEVPGFSVNELQVSLEPARVTISGKKESACEQKEATSVYKEECSSEMFRTIDLPEPVDVSKSTASLNNGVLTLELPKAEGKSTRVEVRSA